MSARETAIINFPEISQSKTSLLSKSIDLISSVSFGIILLILLILLCFLGMIISQENSPGFEAYFSQLTLFQQILYSSLGLFDVYHSWYFTATLGLLSLNIILASIDRFPKTWSFISQPKIDVSEEWLCKQKPNYSISLQGTKDEVVKKITNNYKSNGWRKIKVGENTLFAESGAWNRLGAYPVHLALLIIFFGGFLTAQLSFSGEIPLTIGQSANRIQSAQLPFTVICTDLEQKLINPKGSTEITNTLDWLTQLQIKDEFGTHEAVVQLNRPFDYRGYRIFHSNFLPMGKARSVTIQYNSEQLNFKQNETKTLADGTNIRLVDFRANFSLNKETANEHSTRYQNPAAVFEIQTPNSKKETVYAQKNSPIKLLDFERVSEQHTLFVRYDPGAPIIYFGFALLSLSLVAVFFFSHQRVWSILQETSENNFIVTIGGNCNRNQTVFENKFKRFINKIL